MNCPLGIPHPPPNNDPSKGGVFPLGCGVCRSEKTDLLKNRDVQQVISADTIPKALIGYENDGADFWNGMEEDEADEREEMIRNMNNVP